MANDSSKTQPTAPKDTDQELGFDPESPDVADPGVDPTHPARTSNDPEPTPQIRGGGDDVTRKGGGV